MKNILSTIAACLLFAACNSDGRKDYKDIRKTADSFADAYFNYDFKSACNHCTVESEKWLHFAASNVIDEDIELLRAEREGATHEVIDVNCVTDTSAMVSLTVRNFLKRDTLGRPGYIMDNDFFVIKLVRRSEKWLVDARSIAQAGRR